ncbi:unnamed protein product [Plutella xylostella]|uniref:(diamondback moth) hypothetical protein n=1 Tax=Plutella xylostella TaxID=51655 RepID=A0A8S4FS42_PLUXY|nr:unnamed protein product [Plutella xylostella]
MVIDYRKLNEVSKGDKYPIPNIVDILDKLGKSKYFSTLDLASGCHQIDVDPRDVEKTAFATEEGHFEYLRMPIGLKNAPATFQRVMDNVLTGLTEDHCLVNLDDIIIHASSLEEHELKLRNILKRLRDYNLKLQPDKCEFFRKEVAYLGHIISDQGIKPNPDKIKAVQNFPQPKTTKQIKAFLGLAGYYLKDPGSRLIRWRLELEQYDYKIVYKQGKKNQNADALSRTGINVIDDDIMSHFKDQLKNRSIGPIEIVQVTFWQD